MSAPDDPGPGAAGPAFLPHPDSFLVRDEVHARPVFPLPADRRLRRVGFAYPELRGGGREILARLEGWCAGRGLVLDRHSDRHVGYVLDGLSVTVELHTEFASITWRSALDDERAWPSGIGLEVFAGLPLLFATRIDVTDAVEIAPATLNAFNPISLCHALVDGRRARIATDFHADADGFTRYELAAAQCSDLRRGMILRRVLEIETYRVMAMLGLPTARRIGPLVDAMEAELAEVLATVNDNATIEDHQKSLARLNAISQRAERQSAETSYRFAAGRAYGDILNRRITRLGEESIGDYTTIARYLSNRVDPALATCAAVEKRQVAILDQTARATHLLGTRIGLDVQIQNKALLDTISATTRNQYRLQTTIENISTVALSYYVLGILSYVLAPVPFPDYFGKTAALAALAPFVIVLVYFGVRRLRRSHGA